MSDRNFSDSDVSEGEGTSLQKYRVRKSKLIGMINWTHVFGTYTPHLFYVGVFALALQIIIQVLQELNIEEGLTFVERCEFIQSTVKELVITLLPKEEHPLLPTSVKTTIFALIILVWLVRMDNPIYLMSFATFKCPDEWKITHQEMMEIYKKKNCFNEESLKFLQKILQRSGTGQTTAYPPGIVRTLRGQECDTSIEACREEAETIICNVVNQALQKSNCNPKEIDILIINCSLFSPTPSLCAMVCHKFGLREDVETYNLSGMGCSASLISIELAKNLLQRRHVSNFFPFIMGGGRKALVVSTEILTPNFYHGNERSFLLQNTLFRCGGAAMVISNKWTDGSRAWYKLLHTVRVQGSGEESYQCVYETQDHLGERGIRLSKEITQVAGKCMEKNLSLLGPWVLPISEQAKVVFSMVARFLVKTMGIQKHVRIYVPDFKTAIDHFCIHAGGRAVIDGIEKNLNLTPYLVEPSRMTLLNYGNTSSSSIWYELEYVQSSQKSNPLKKGHRIMQLAFGSGFKCTSAVWLKL